MALSITMYSPLLRQFPALSSVSFANLLRRRPCHGPSLSAALVAGRRRRGTSARDSLRQQQQQLEEEEEARAGAERVGWGKVSAVLFDMDGVLCNSEELSRLAAVDVFAEMGVSVTPEDFIPFMGTVEANFLGDVASVKGVQGFDPLAAKKRFFEIYIDKYAKPNSGIGFPGALELITECKRRGLKVTVASSADRIKIDANLAAAALSKFEVEIDLPDSIKIEPINGYLSPEGTASLKFKRNSSSPAMGRINCKVYYCKEDEVCLYQSVAFDVSFQEEPESNQTVVNLSYTVKPKVLPDTPQLTLSK